ncbi:MAG: TetR family transcriptional regulator [Crocinitomicaceae bacterium]|nr:TetR family transcriptional regulator [Crocinitomicaceae bacterium]|tara:strand:- start:194 stop:784 length:591 start_codon:yes stop_codon:yes gene_type:complete
MKKSERTKQFIIEQTAPIFNKKGYAGTSLSDLTNATGLTKGAIYGNFSNKDEVAVAAFDYNFGLLSQAINKRMLLAETAEDQLLVFINFYLEYYDTVLMRGGCPILNTAIDADDGNPQLFNKVKAALNRWIKGVQTIVERGVEEKEFNTSIAPETFATLFTSLIEGGILLSKTTGETKHLITNLQYLKKLVRQLKE